MSSLEVEASLSPKLQERMWKQVDKTEACWIWTGAKNPKGYGRITFAPGNTGKVCVHRLSYRIAYGDIPEGMYVCHHCDNPSCVRPEHLFLGDASANGIDSLRKRGYTVKRPTKSELLKRVKELEGHNEALMAQIANPLRCYT